MFNIINVKADKKFVVVERDLSNVIDERKPLKQVDRSIKIYDALTKTILSPYARKSSQTQYDLKSYAPYVSGEDQLKNSQEKNVSLEGLSAQEVAKMREELFKTIKPETLEAMKNLVATKKLIKKEKTKEEILLSKIQEICKESEETNGDTEKLTTEKKDDDEEDFEPVSPKNTFLNMDKFEKDKSEWMKNIDKKEEEAKSLSIRFHIDGRAITDDMEIKEFDPYQNSLRHHGEEPAREGYTINELFWLSRSSFPQQKHLAVMTLKNVLKCSKNLEHAHQFNFTMITQNLVDCGILFLARWLIDDAGLVENYLADALSLMHAIIVADNNDQYLINWPNLRISSGLPRLMSHESTKAERARKFIPLSEKTEIHDDVLMDEDIITCLVMNTHLVTRISWIMVASHFVMPQVDAMILQILQRISAHSSEMANHLVNDHEPLIAGLMQTHLNTESSSCVHLLRLLRLIVGTSQLLANKITGDKKIITALYPIIEDASVDIDTKIEALRLLAVLVLQGVHLKPIVALTSIIIENFIVSLAEPTVTPYSQSMAMFLVALINSKAEILTETYTALTNAVGLCKDKIKNTIHLDNSFSAMSTLVHLCNIFFRHQYSARNEFSTQVAISHWNDLVCPLLRSNIFPAAYEHASLNTVLGYEHWHQNITLVKLDLTNSLQYSTTLAGQTANPDYVDFKPFFVNLHPSFSMLSALSQMLLSMTDSEMETSLLPNFAESFSNLANNEFLTKYLTRISETPMDKIVPSTAPYSAIVQLELETLSHVLLTIVGVSQWTKATLSHHFATILYKVAVRILPFLGPDLQYLAHELSEAILFSPTIISIMESGLPQEVKSLLLHQLPNLKQLYKEHIPSFEQAVPLLESLSTNISIDKFIIAADWIDSPILELYKITKQDHNVELNTNNMMSCLTFVMFLELGNIMTLKESSMVGLYRLSYLLISVKWIDIFSDENNKLVVSSLMSHYLAQPRLIDINARINKKLSFYDLYQDLLMKYFFESLSDTTMANIVIFPCAMRFPAKYRRHLWSDYFGHLRLLTIDVSQSMLSIDEYLSPEESNNDMIRYYWRAIRDEIVTEDMSPLLYWVCVHHLNRFVYNQTIGLDEKVDSKELMATQRGLARVLSHVGWQHKTWLQHIRLYKHLSENAPQFYDSVPTTRVKHLQRLCAAVNINIL